MGKKEHHKKQNKKKQKDVTLATISITTSKGKVVTFEIEDEEKIKKRRNPAYQYLI